MTTDEQLRDAIDRLARSPDGYLLYLYLQKRLMAVRMTETDSTLREDNGERMFAAKLIGLMAKGIQESAGSSEPIVTFAVAGPRPVANSRAGGRRVTLDTAVAGWDNPDAEPERGSDS